MQFEIHVSKYNIYPDTATYPKSPSGYPGTTAEYPRTRGYKTFFMLNSVANEICSAFKKLNTNNLNFFNCKAEMSMKFLLLINIKMPTIVQNSF